MQPLTEADYRRIIDAETWAFIDKTNSFYPTDTYMRTIAEQRKIYDRMCAAFAQPYPEGVAAKDKTANGVPVRHYTKDGAASPVTVIYAHGGSLSLGGLHSHDDVCAEICAATGYEVVAVDYRLSPEHSAAEASDDMAAVLAAMRGEGRGRLVLAGDSAGGYLAAKLARANRGAGDIVGQVLIYPGLGGGSDGGSMTRQAFAPMLTRAEVVAARDFGPSTAERARAGQPAPLDDSDYSGLPPTVAVAAECDPLADDARLYAERIRAAGGTALWFEDKGLVHGHLRARHMSRRARTSFDRVLRAIALLGAGEGLDAISPG